MLVNGASYEFKIGLFAGFIISAGMVLRNCIFRVEQGNVGVLISFGRALFLDESKGLLRTLGPGLHYKWPWQKAHSVSMMEQSLDLSGEEGGISAMASDGTILRLDSKLRYTPEKSELYDFLFALKNPISHIQGLFTCLLRNEIANFSSQPEDLAKSSSYSVIRRERKLLNQHIRDFTRSKIGGRYGLRFDAVDLTDIYPPDELADALNAVFNAQSEAETAYARIEAECQQRVLSASKGIEIAAARAEASETEILTLAKSLAHLQMRGTLQAYVDRRRSETYSESRTVFVRRSL